MELAEFQSKDVESPLRALKAQGLKPVKISDGLYSVPSGSRAGVAYTVDPVEMTCSCPDFQYRGNRCKHLLAVERILGSDVPDRELSDDEARSLLAKGEPFNDYEKESIKRITKRPSELFPSETACNLCKKHTVDLVWAGDDGWICRECKEKKEQRDRVIYFG